MDLLQIFSFLIDLFKCVQYNVIMSVTSSAELIDFCTSVHVVDIFK